MFYSIKDGFLSHFTFIKRNLSFFDLFFFVLFFIFLFFYYSSFSIFLGFLSGNFYCIILELSLFWRYLLIRFKDRQQKYDIKIFFRKKSFLFPIFTFFQMKSCLKTTSIQILKTQKNEVKNVVFSSINTMLTLPF